MSNQINKLKSNNPDYQEIYDSAYNQCKKDIASNPLSIFDLLPDMQSNAEKLMSQHKEQMSEEYKAMFEKALSGEVGYEDFLKFTKEQANK